MNSLPDSGSGPATASTHHFCVNLRIGQHLRHSSRPELSTVHPLWPGKRMQRPRFERAHQNM